MKNRYYLIHDLSGQVFTRLTVIKRVELERKKPYFLCVCECGTEKIVRSDKLRSGNTQSCGCLQKERATTHGLTKTTEYVSWRQMRYRCNNPNFHNYHRYGGRGITVHPDFDDFEVFLAHIGPKPSPIHSVDRINNNGNYAPDNVRWATPLEQANNKG